MKEREIKKMKQSSTVSVSPTSLFDDDEVEVANTLLDLRNLIPQFECRSEFRGFSIDWGCKRRRSNANRGFGRLVSHPPPPAAAVISPSPSPPPKDSRAEPEISVVPKVKPEVLSPATPLSFSPSESDEKPISSSRKNSKKRTREEWMRNLDELSHCKEILIGQLENVRAYYNNQMAYNLKLKAMKQEILSRSHKVKGDASTTVLGPNTNVAQQYPQYERPIILDPLGQMFHYQFVQKDPRQCFVASQNGLGYRLGPVGIPDLNVSVEESMMVGCSQPFDLRRMEGDKQARYAEARRSRFIKNKLKIKSGPRTITR